MYWHHCLCSSQGSEKGVKLVPSSKYIFGAIFAKSLEEIIEKEREK